jgi:hypothetical protein
MARDKECATPNLLLAAPRRKVPGRRFQCRLRLLPTRTSRDDARPAEVRNTVDWLIREILAASIGENHPATAFTINSGAVWVCAGSNINRRNNSGATATRE